MDQEQKHKKELVKQLYLFTTLGLIAGTVYGLYYGIFLYRNTFDIKILVIDSLLVAVSGWIGYILGTFFIHRSGYLKTLRLSFLLLATVSIITLLLIESIRSVYPMLSVLRGIPIGIGAAVIDIFLLKEIPHISRGRFFNINLSIEFVIAVILPFAVGGLITVTEGYETTFLLAGMIYFAALFLPIHYNKRPHSLTSLRDELHMLRKKGIGEYNFNTVLTAGADGLNGLLLAIVPFLLFGSELEVGIFASLIAIVAALVSFSARNMKYHRQVTLGYFGSFGRLISNVVLAVFWNPVALVFQGLLNKGLAVFNDPIFKKIRLNNAAKVLGSDLNKEALELNLLNSTMTLFGQVMAFGAFLVILEMSQSSQIAALRYLLVFYGVWKIVNYLWVLNMGRRFTHYQHEAEIPVHATELAKEKAA